MSRNSNPTKWLGLKDRMIEEGILHSFFRESPDQIVTRNLRGNESDPPEHEPLMFDSLLRDVAGHLDRAVAYRREMRELEVLAVKAGAEYKLFKEQSKLDFDIDKLRQGVREKELLRDAHRKASTAFGSESALATGFAHISSGAADECAQELLDLQEEMRLLALKFKQANDYQDEYNTRHQDPGNAHNYGQRAGQIARLLEQEVVHAHAKSCAISRGFWMIYGRQAQDLPGKEDPLFIDNLVLWVRGVIDFVEFEGEKESEYDLLIPLCQPMGKKSDGSPIAGIVSQDTWKSSMTKTEAGSKPFKISFKLSPTLFRGVNVRLRRIGLAYGTSTSVGPTDIDRAAAYDTYAKYRAIISSPSQKRFGSGASYRRPPVFIGSMSVFGTPLAYSDGPECLNIDPVGVDSWEIEVDPIPVSKDLEVRHPQIGMLESHPWEDLKLYLRVRSHV